MASPSVSEATNWDPLGMNSPAARALIVLRPENEAAKLAFSEVIDFIKEQHHVPSDDTNATDVRAHYAKFVWFSDEQIYDAKVSRFANQKSASESSSSSSSNIEESYPTMTWTGFFFIDTDIKSFGYKRWVVGRLSKKSVSFEQPTVDLVLTTKRVGNVARRHAAISFSNETHFATVSLEFGSSAHVNTHSLTSRGDVAGCTFAKNRVNFGDLVYTLEYTSYCRQSQGQTDLNNYLTSLHGDNQPTKEILQATPTPYATIAQTIGKYTFTAGLTGLGAFGRVRPAVGPDGQKIVAIKTIEAKSSRVRSIRAKISLMEVMAQRSKNDNQLNVLTMVESIYIQGRQIHEFHVVLEPFIGFTLYEIPKDTHPTKYELILHDCLRGLVFLHTHRIVHTDIKPPNIGLLDFHKDQMHMPAHLAPASRPLRAILLDIDSVEQIPDGQSTIKALPGGNGTVGFHSPEHETSEYDGRTDVWALGVSLYRAVFGALPWSYGPEGNPWREDCKSKNEARAKFHTRYDRAVCKIANHYQVLGEALCDFMITAFRFPDSEIYTQKTFARPTSAECVELVVERSEFLKERVAKEEQMATEAIAATRATRAIGDIVHAEGRAKRPAPES